MKFSERVCVLAALWAGSLPNTVSATAELANLMRPLFQKYDPNTNLFSIMDVDGGGDVSYEEFATFFEIENKQVPQQFWAQEDRNGDGVISFAEFSGPKVAGGANQRAVSSQGGAATRTGVGMAPVVSFDALDTNVDGVVASDEFNSYFYFMFAQGRTTQKHPSREALALSGVPDLFKQHDLNNDELISRQEYSQYWNRV